jgi:hypothetical protein
MSRRGKIRMSEEEVAAFLADARTLTCATNGPRGVPHLMPLWYVIRSDGLWAWTYASSQKVRNLERDPRATLQIETGATYDQLRGVMLECEVVVHRDPEVVLGVGLEIANRYGGGVAARSEPARAALRAQAAKRVGLQFLERKRASFDHRKLGGAY